MNTKPGRVTALAVALVSLGILPLPAVTFTIDAPSPSVGVIGSQNDLYNPGAIPVIPGFGGPGIEVDAISYGRTGAPVMEIFFSVAPGAIGVPGTAVSGEGTGFSGVPLTVADEGTDVFYSTGTGFNLQVWDGNGVVAFPPTPGSPSPPLGLIEPPAPGAPGVFDNVDGLDMRLGPVVLPMLGPSIFWSVDVATAVGAPPYVGLGATAADIFWSPAIPGYSAAPVMYAPAAMIGLLLGDNIDALVYFEDGIGGPSPGDIILFSLAPGSPTLAALGGASPADILVTSPGMLAPGFYLPAGALGLTPMDNIDALDIIPEPGGVTLAILASAGFLLGRRRKTIVA
jgi:hypothetical protein